MIVYLAHNKITTQNYVGQSNFSLEKRKGEHERSIKKYYFHNSIKKYGKRNFEWYVLRECGTQEETNLWEDFYIKLLMSNNKEFGYNLKTGGSNGKLSEETKRKISEANKKRPYPSFETREKIRLSKLGNRVNVGREMSEETKKKLSKKGRQRYIDNPQMYEKLRLISLGRKHNEETKRRIGKKSKGNKNCLGRKVTEMTRERMSESAKLAWRKRVAI